MEKKYVVITGATSGFGEACAELFASKGWNLLLTGRRKDRLEQLKDKLSQLFHVDVIISCFDVRDEMQVNQAIDVLSVEVKQHIYLLINNAGLAVGRGPIQDGLTDDWNRMIDTNVKGLLYVSRA